MSTTISVAVTLEACPTTLELYGYRSFRWVFSAEGANGRAPVSGVLCTRRTDIESELQALADDWGCTLSATVAGSKPTRFGPRG